MDKKIDRIFMIIAIIAIILILCGAMTAGVPLLILVLIVGYLKKKDNKENTDEK